MLPKNYNDCSTSFFTIVFLFKVIEELKAMTGNAEDDEDDDEAALLLEEANMPIGQLLERFKVIWSPRGQGT